MYSKEKPLKKKVAKIAIINKIFLHTFHVTFFQKSSNYIIVIIIMIIIVIHSVLHNSLLYTQLLKCVKHRLIDNDNYSLHALICIY